MSRKIKKDIANYMNRLYNRQLTTASGGNISYKNKNTIYITASQTDKGNMTFRNVGKVHIDGTNLTPKLKLSMETRMHIEIYKQRPDIQAIIHAHPLTATTLSANKNLIDVNFNGETRAMVGQPAFANYALMGTPALAQNTASASTQSNVIILQHHGIIALGKTLLQAFDRMELMEMAAKATVIKHQMKIENKLSDNEIAKIDQLGHSSINSTNNDN